MLTPLAGTRVRYTRQRGRSDTLTVYRCSAHIRPCDIRCSQVGRCVELSGSDCVGVTNEPRSQRSGEPAGAAAGRGRAEVSYRVLSVRTIAVWALLIVVVGVGVAAWLLLAFTGGDTDANRVQLDAIRTAGTVIVGTGGAAALLLAARRQRSTEIALAQKDRDQADVARAHALQERSALANEADAAARRITDLYTKAADQLGSEKAPVRLAGLYALERLAQDHVEQRQTITNVLCAYLRMPYTLPGDPPAADAREPVRAEYRERLQEREVRLAAQRILAHHLRNGDPAQPVGTFWADIDLDLTSAVLIDLEFTGCTARNAIFSGAAFTGDTAFGEVTFTGGAWFNRATFTGNAWFGEATFTSNAVFNGATFTDLAWFAEATFTGDTMFREAMFAGLVLFRGVKLPVTPFRGSSYPSSPWTDFEEARFAGEVPPELEEFLSPPEEKTV